MNRVSTPARVSAHTPAHVSAHMPARVAAHMPARVAAHMPARVAVHMPALQSTLLFFDSQNLNRPFRTKDGQGYDVGVGRDRSGTEVRTGAKRTPKQPGADFSSAWPMKNSIEWRVSSSE